MSFLHTNLREWIMSKLMSVSVSHSAKKNPDFVDEIPLDDNGSKQLTPKSSQGSTEILESPLRSERGLSQENETIEYLLGDQLTREFGFDRDLSQIHTLHLCLYKINNVLSSPFLEFIMEKDTVEYEFYHKDMPPELFKEFIQDQDDTISVATNESARIEPIDEEIPEEKIIGGSQGEGELDVEDVFLDQIKSLFQEKTGSLLIDKKYKGFLEIDNHIFAIIDVEGVAISEEDNQKWAIVDEISHKKTILNIAVSPLIIDLFTKNRVLGKFGQETPQVLYLCKKNNDAYQNVYYEEGEGSHNTVTIINERIQHPILKHIYLFSEIPFSSDLPIAQIKRFALFTDPVNKIQGEISGTNIPQEPVIGFQENEIDFWCTKSPKYFAEL